MLIAYNLYKSYLYRENRKRMLLVHVFVIVFNFSQYSSCNKKQKEPKEMKIENNANIQKSLYPDKTNKNEKPQRIDFKAFLKNEVEKSSNVIAGNQKMPPISGISPIQQNMLSPAQNGSIIDRVESLLSILDEYQQKLKDPHFSLKEIDPIVKQMEKEKENLAPALNSLGEDDGLKDILNQALVTSSLETIKFNRGDYI